MYNASSSPVITDSTFDGNLAEGFSSDGEGGAIYSDAGSNPVIVSCSFATNRARSTGGSGVGGAVSNVGGDTVILDSVFASNTASSPSYCRGGAFFNDDGSPRIANSLFSNNQAGCSHSSGGAIFTMGALQAPRIVNCTFASNDSASIYIDDRGGAIYCSDFGSPSVYNCVFWGNQAATNGGSDIYETSQSNLVVRYSCVQTSGARQGSSSNIVLGASPFGSEYRLANGSACIDAGSNISVPADTYDLDGDGNLAEPLPTDLAGNPRFTDDPTAANTGSGTPPIVDVGAYERP